MSARQHSHDYGFGVTLDLGFDETVARVRAELAAEGFGVLTEIDVAGTLKKKLNVDFRRYVILGACNPPLAHKALSTELEVGLLLPCNVIVYEAQPAGSTVVSIMDPAAVLPLVGNREVNVLAADVKARLRRVIQRLAAVTHTEVAGSPRA